MLAKRFRDPFVVAAAHRKKIESWPRIAAYDTHGLKTFSDFPIECEKAMERISSLRVLNNNNSNNNNNNNNNNKNNL